MKSIYLQFLFIFSLLFSAVAYSQAIEKFTLETEQLHGNVQSVRRKEVDIRENKPDTIVRNDLMLYNSAGELIRLSYFNRQDSVKQIETWSYDQQGRIDSTTSTSFYSSGWKSIDVYHHGVNKLEVKSYNSNGEYNYSTFYEFDRFGRIVMSYFVDEDGSENLGKFASSGDLVVQKWYAGGAGEKAKNPVFLLDEIDTLKRSVTSAMYDQNKIYYYDRMTYEGNSDRVSTIVVPDTTGLVGEFIKYEYDEWGNMKKCTATSHGVTEIDDYVYIFDDRKNWTSKKIITNGRTRSVTTRQITYFD